MYKMTMLIMIRVDIQGEDAHEAFQRLEKVKKELIQTKIESGKVKDAITHRMLSEENF